MAKDLYLKAQRLQLTDEGVRDLANVRKKIKHDYRWRARYVGIEEKTGLVLVIREGDPAMKVVSYAAKYLKPAD